MLEKLYYIEYEGRNEKYHNELRFQLAFVFGKLFLFLLPFLFLLYKLGQHGILNWYTYFDYSGKTRLSVIFISFIILYIYSYHTFFKLKKRTLILQKYSGRYKTLIKHSLLFSLSLFIFAPLLLLLLIELFSQLF